MAKSKARPEKEPIKVPLSALADDPKNPRKMTDEARAGLGVSMETFGELGMVFNDRTGQMVSGHQRLERLRTAGATEVVRTGSEGYIVHPKTGERFRVRFVDWDETKQRMANLVANNPHIAGDFTEDAVAQLKELEDVEGFAEMELGALEADLAAELGLEEGGGIGDGAPSGSLSDRFGMPPFSVLDARSGRWQQRKREWLAMGIQSEVGRGDCTPGGRPQLMQEQASRTNQRIRESGGGRLLARDHEQDDPTTEAKSRPGAGAFAGGGR